MPGPLVIKSPSSNSLSACNDKFRTNKKASSNALRIATVDNFFALPSKFLIKIFAELDFKDIYNCTCSCKRARIIIKDLDKDIGLFGLMRAIRKVKLKEVIFKPLPLNELDAHIEIVRFELGESQNGTRSPRKHLLTFPNETNPKKSFDVTTSMTYSFTSIEILDGVPTGIFHRDNIEITLIHKDLSPLHMKMLAAFKKFCEASDVKKAIRKPSKEDYKTTYKIIAPSFRERLGWLFYPFSIQTLTLVTPEDYDNKRRRHSKGSESYW